MTRSLSITRAELECFCSSFQATKRRCETLHQKGKTFPPKNTCTIPASLTRSSSLHESVYTHAITQKYFVNRDIQSSRRAAGRPGERRQCFQERRPLFKTMGRGKKQNGHFCRGSPGRVFTHAQLDPTEPTSPPTCTAATAAQINRKATGTWTESPHS